MKFYWKIAAAVFIGSLLGLGVAVWTTPPVFQSRGGVDFLLELHGLDGRSLMPEMTFCFGPNEEDLENSRAKEITRFMGFDDDEVGMMPFEKMMREVDQKLRLELRYPNNLTLIATGDGEYGLADEVNRYLSKKINERREFLDSLVVESLKGLDQEILDTEQMIAKREAEVEKRQKEYDEHPSSRWPEGTLGIFVDGGPKWRWLVAEKEYNAAIYYKKNLKIGQALTRKRLEVPRVHVENRQDATVTRKLTRWQSLLWRKEWEKLAGLMIFGAGVAVSVFVSFGKWRKRKALAV